MELSVNKNRQFRKLPYAVVDLAIEEGWTKQLSYYLHITSIFGNGVIYNYSSRSLAEKLGCSKSTVHKNVSFLLKLGLFKVSDKGHLIGLSNKELIDWVYSYQGTPTGKGLVTVKIHKYIKHTEYNLFSRVAINNINQQKFSARKRAEVNAIGATIKEGSYISASDYAKYKKNLQLVERYQTEKANKFFTGEDCCYLSDYKMAKLSGKSVGTVRNMIKFWQSEGLLDFQFVKGTSVGVASNSRAYEALVAERPEEFSNTYLYKGRIIKCNRRIISYGSSLTRMNPNSI